MEAIVAEPGQVQLRSCGKVSVPSHHLASAVVLLGCGLAPMHQHDRCHGSSLGRVTATLIDIELHDGFCCPGKERGGPGVRALNGDRERPPCRSELWRRWDERPTR